MNHAESGAQDPPGPAHQRESRGIEESEALAVGEVDQDARQPRLVEVGGDINEVADLLPGKLVIDPSNPVSYSADGSVSRTLPDGQSSGQVVSGLLPQGTRFVKAFGTMSAPMLGSSAYRDPRAVLFYASDDDTAGAQTEKLIRAAGFEPVRAGGLGAAIRIEVGGDLHAFGGLNGRVVDKAEAQSLLAPSRA